MKILTRPFTTSKINTQVFQQNQGTPFLNSLPKDSVSFGGCFSNNEASIDKYKQKSSKRTVIIPEGYNTDKKNFIFGNKIHLQGNLNLPNTKIIAGNNLKAQKIKALKADIGNNANIEESINATDVKTKDGLKTKNIKAEAWVSIGNNANVEESIESGWYTYIGDNLKTKNIKAGAEASLGKNANVENSISTFMDLVAGDGLETKKITSYGDICLGSIKKLEELFFLETPELRGKTSRILKFYSSEIIPQKIKVFIDEISDLTIKYQDNIKILDKLEFFKVETGKMFSNNEVENFIEQGFIKIVKIVK